MGRCVRRYSASRGVMLAVSASPRLWRRTAAMLAGDGAWTDIRATSAVRSRSRRSSFCAFSSPMVVTGRPT